MKLVSTTLTGNSELHIGQALESACGLVDACIVIDTGVTDRTLEIAREVAGDKLVVRQWPWRNDFAAARNAALQFAEEEGADLAVTLDSDEQLLFRPNWSRQQFEDNPDVDAWYAEPVDRSYMKERVLRTGRGLCWEGPVHEHLAGLDHTRKAVTLSLAFTEKAKNPVQMVHKNERDLAILQAYAPQHPDNPRWWMYLGLTLYNMGRYDEALPHLMRAAQMNDYAGFDGKHCVQRVVRCFFNTQRYAEGIEFVERAWQANPAEPSFGYYQKMLHERTDLLGPRT